jgi:hypothetical protein
MEIKSLRFPWANWTLLATIFYLAGLCPGLTQTVQAAKPSLEAKKLVETINL